MKYDKKNLASSIYIDEWPLEILKVLQIKFYSC
jgi:hypothetical protein